MVRHNKSLLAVIFGLSMAHLPGIAGAAVSWTFDNANCLSTDPTSACSSQWTTTRTYDGVGPDAVDVTVSAWSSTEGILNMNLNPAQITHWGSNGLGVRNADYTRRVGTNGRDRDRYEGSSPEHAIDNNGRPELVLFDFSDEQGENLVTLEDVEFGWTNGANGDSEISVLRYVGVGDPTDSNPLNPESLDNEDVSDAGETLTAPNGWELVGHYDPGTGNNRSQSINPDKLSSSYWLIGAYTPIFGGDCYGSDPTVVTSSCNAGNDYFKLASVSGTVPSISAVPEPALSVLLLSALPLFLAFKRRK